MSYLEQLTPQDIQASLNRLGIQQGRCPGTYGGMRVYDLPCREVMFTEFMRMNYDYVTDQDTLDEAIYDLTSQWMVDSWG